MPKPAELLNKTFGRLLVIEFAGKNLHGDRLWLCRCSCGKEPTIRGYSLTRGQSNSCGCLRVELGVLKSTKHGMSGVPEYRVWTGMKYRCYNPNDTEHWKDYGGRGIQVCEKWRKDFKAFYTDMGPRPSPTHTLDRKDVNGNYEPDNCKWATKTEQVQNRRPMRRIEGFTNEEIKQEYLRRRL
jgi:hypothetical protein